MIYRVKSGATDISDYVIDCGEVPAIMRNRDFTPVLGEVTMLVSAAINDELIESGATIKIAYESNSFYPFYIGLVQESIYDYNERAYRLQIISKLKLLADRVLSYESLHGFLASGATAQQYRASDNEGYPSVQLMWLIQKMFQGVTINLSLPPANTFIEIVQLGGINRVINLEHLRIDENMLYALNQSVATNHTNIDADPDKQKSRLTWWDFFRVFCSCIGTISTVNIGFDIRWSQTATPEQLQISVRNNDPIIITDDLTYGRENFDYVIDSRGYSYNILFANRGAYALPAATGLADHSYAFGEGYNEVSIYNNLVIMYERYWDAPGNTFGFTAYPTNNYKPGALLSNRIIEVNGGTAEKKYETSSQIITRVKESSIDLNTSKAILVQER